MNLLYVFQLSLTACDLDLNYLTTMFMQYWRCMMRFLLKGLLFVILIIFVIKYLWSSLKDTDDSFGIRGI